MTDLESLIANLRKLASAATPGPWWTGESYGADHGREYEVSTEGGLGVWIAKCQDSRIAPYIAAVDPQTVLRLCDKLEEAIALAELVATPIKKGTYKYSPMSDRDDPPYYVEEITDKDDAEKAREFLKSLTP